MTRKCQLDNTKVVCVGNNVSHSNRKTRRRFLPNIQNYSLMSDALHCCIKLKATPSSVRTIECHNGLDNFLLTTPNYKLAPEAIKIKRRVKKAIRKKSKSL